MGNLSEKDLLNILFIIFAICCLLLVFAPIYDCGLCVPEYSCNVIGWRYD